MKIEKYAIVKETTALNTVGCVVSRHRIKVVDTREEADKYLLELTERGNSRYGGGVLGAGEVAFQRQVNSKGDFDWVIFAVKPLVKDVLGELVYAH